MKYTALSVLSLFCTSALLIPGVQAAPDLYAPRALSPVANPVIAQAMPKTEVASDSALRRPRAEAPPANAAQLGMGVTPVMVVFLAYQGFFESEGIPKFEGLVSENLAGRVTAKDLIQAAIAMKRLPETTLSDQAYLSAVDYQLMSLRRNLK